MICFSSAVQFISKVQKAVCGYLQRKLANVDLVKVFSEIYLFLLHELIRKKNKKKYKQVQ